MSRLSDFDAYLSSDGPAALVLREWLMPVEGADGVVFPATFADIGYNIDTPADVPNATVIDSVGTHRPVRVMVEPAKNSNVC